MVADEDLFKDMLNRFINDIGKSDSSFTKEDLELRNSIHKLVINNQIIVAEILHKLFKFSDYNLIGASPQSYLAHEFTLFWSGFILGVKFGEDCTSFSIKN